jgi:hypothetical protein
MTRVVSVMQPYIFPYIGYFNLAQASDIFVFYDDVNYIKQGWINRNRILINKTPYTFSIPLKNGSSFELIKNVLISDLDKFKSIFYKQLEQSYCKAKYFNIGIKYVEDVLSLDSDSISRLAIKSVMDFFTLVDIEKQFMVSSESFPSSKGIDRADRLLDIVKSVGSSHYVNTIGGMPLYDKAYFAERGVKLSFIKPLILEYGQVGKGDFVAGLSIIDVLMNIGIDGIRTHLDSYELV